MSDIIPIIFTDKSVAPAAFKLKAACEYLGGLSPLTVRRLVKQGRLKRHPALRHLVITKLSLDQFLAEADASPMP